MADDPAPRSRVGWMVVAVASGSLGAVALASRGSGVFGRLQDGTSPFGSTVARAGLGLLAGAAVGLAAAGVARATNRRHQLISPGSPRPPWPLVLSWALPVIVLLAAVGAAAGAATSPLHPRQPSSTPDGSAGTAGTPQARLTDLDGNGAPDTDGSGRARIVADLDGDGRFETTLQPCPGATWPEPSTRSDGSDRVAIDRGCDGRIDRMLPLNRQPLTEIGTGPGGSGRSGAGEAGQRTLGRTPNLGAAGRTLGLIVLAVAAIGTALLARRLWRRRSARPRPVPILPPPMHAPAAADPLDAVATVLDDTARVMLADPDARTAINAAYAQLLAGLAAAGLPRAGFEAPGEHLERCLTGLPVLPQPMRQLVEIFSLARFGHHPVTEEHRTDALAALASAQEDLGRLTPAVGAS